jgi:hypothetical protein
MQQLGLLQQPSGISGTSLNGTYTIPKTHKEEIMD